MPQCVIPIYQRTYSWTERECQQLWDDILRVGSDDDVAAHFVGSIVYIETSLYAVVEDSPLLVIDGQQRLTTLTLLLEALARSVGHEEPMEGFSAEKIRSYYLLNPIESGEKRFKLLLTQNDRDSLLAILRQKDLPDNASTRIEDNFRFFEEKLSSLKGNITPIWLGISKLMLVDISLSREQDNPQLIFESMNSTGRELSQADLIRNFVLMGLEPEHQSELYDEHWRPMEVAFGQEAYGKYFDGFMRHYLTVKTGEIPNVNEVYEAFKALSRKPEIAAQGVDKIVAEVHASSLDYCAMALDQETDKELALAFRDLRELKVDVAYPFLLELYADYKSGILTKEDFESTLRLIESYVFRRAVCAIPTNSLNKTFATFGRALNKDAHLESIKAHFLTLPSYRRFPSDEEFKRELKVRDLYNFRSRTYWLRRLENFSRKERVPVDEYTIEHILPQNENLREEWKIALGPDWRETQEALLHTLGNLTLTGYNSEYGDLPFDKKRDMDGGFKDSPLKLNEGLGVLDDWNGETIQGRAEKLAEKATVVWVRPTLPEETLALYASVEGTKQASYEISDHEHLSETSPMRPLFEQFRTLVKNLDPTVTEEFLKLYVAYKAETNFVDVVPQVSRLRLSLNMDFPEINDPDGMAKDVTGRGRWGNGNVEVHLSSEDQLPYVMGLIKQSFEKQMGDDAPVDSSLGGPESSPELGQ